MRQSNIINECNKSASYADKVLEAYYEKFTFPSILIHELKTYQIKHWSVSYFVDYYDRHIKDDYIILIDCTIGQLRVLASLNPNHQVKVSFRELRDNWKQPPVILAKVSTLTRKAGTQNA